MKITSVIARFLLGLIFLVFGLNGFLNFIPMPPPTGVAGQFLGALFVSHLLVPIFAIQLIGAGLLLVNRYVPLALTLLGPIIVNILLISGRPDSTDKDSLKGVAGSNSPSRSDFLRHQVSASHYCPPVSTPSKQVSRSVDRSGADRTLDRDGAAQE